MRVLLIAIAVAAGVFLGVLLGTVRRSHWWLHLRAHLDVLRASRGSGVWRRCDCGKLFLARGWKGPRPGEQHGSIRIIPMELRRPGVSTDMDGL